MCIKNTILKAENSTLGSSYLKTFKSFMLWETLFNHTIPLNTFIFNHKNYITHKLSINYQRVHIQLKNISFKSCTLEILSQKSEQTF